MMPNKKSFLLFFLLWVGVFQGLYAQQTVVIDPKLAEHIFVNKEIICLEDPTNKLTFEQISTAYANKFVQNIDYYPKNYNRSSTYWYRVKVKFTTDLEHSSVIEFFDQITDHITAYMPDGKGGYIESKTGADLNFTDRLYQHKNFEFLINNTNKGEHEFYFKVHSKDRVNVIIVYRTVDRFIAYALSEYITFGFFYGMIVIFSFHNLLMYIAVRRRQYLFYILYVLSVGMYEMSSDGIAFQYLWPNHPVLMSMPMG
jgi:hypothetical protein